MNTKKNLRIFGTCGAIGFLALAGSAAGDNSELRLRGVVRLMDQYRHQPQSQRGEQLNGERMVQFRSVAEQCRRWKRPYYYQRHGSERNLANGAERVHFLEPLLPAG